MAFDDTIHITYIYDDKNTIRSTILAGCSVAYIIDIDIHLDNMVSRQNLQNRNLDVRQETKFQGNMEMA